MGVVIHVLSEIIVTRQDMPFFCMTGIILANVRWFSCLG